MDTSLLWAAAGTGLLGSAHCAAMCGPLALAGCSRDGRVVRRDAAGYFASRLVAYAFLGSVMGALGHRATAVLPVESAQRVALVLVAAFALVQGLRALWRARPRSELVQLPRRRETPSLLRTIGGWLPRRGAALGVATAVLPCGMLMGAWMIAATSAHPLTGAAVMAVFSVASAPGLIAPLVARRAIGARLARLSPAWIGLAWCALAIWIGVRPLFMSSHGACH